MLRQSPVQADSREKLKELLQVASGGIVFTTMQKFFPENKGESFPALSKRENIVVIADEAHRSQYDFIDGYARHIRDALPNASFLAFTGTPIERADRSTTSVFGDYIDIYDIEQAVRDGVTVPIYYESRLVKLDIDEALKATLDENFEEVTEGEETEKKEKLKSRWARLEALVGAEKRIKTIAEDIVNHFEERLAAFEGKAMIVCMSRRICIDLYNEIIKLKPEWHNNADDSGEIKVIMTGSASDKADWQQHIRTKQRRKDIGDRFKDAKDALKLVIVRDMWLTGFDIPCLHTMYIDKPMKGLGLMQAIARVNRVFKDKEGGLVVDYIGIADSLKYALSEFTERDRGQVGINKEEAVAVMLSKYESIQHMFHGFAYPEYFNLKTGRERLYFLPEAIAFITAQDDGAKRYIQLVTELSKAFSLAVPHKKTREIADDTAFFQQVMAGIKKITGAAVSDRLEIESAIKQLVSAAVTTDGVIDIFSAAGIKKPDISILSDEFLEEVKGMKHKNLAVELLNKLLNDEIKTIRRTNLVQAKSFLKMLEASILKYHNKIKETLEILEELIGLAKEMREALKRGEALNLNDDEVAFYDALEANDSAVKVLGDETLKDIARELVKAVKSNVSIDWKYRENIRAKLWVIVKRILKKYGYPPDKQQKATETVLEQAELFSDAWAV